MKKDSICKAYNKMCLSYKEKYKKEEEWRELIYKGITTRYIISNYGRIMDTESSSLPTMSISKKHFYVNLVLDNEQYTRTTISRLVALAFIPVPEKYFEAGYKIDDLVVDHKRDGDDDNWNDNTIWNLQWLTHRENISKASNCGYKNFYPIDFRSKLDEMILKGCGNKEIYEMCKKDFGYDKEDVKAQIQVRRRRLGKTLKAHYEHDESYVKEIDKLLKKGLSNDEIIKKLNMPTEGRESERLLQYRRSVLKIPANVSRYLSNEDNKKINEYLLTDLTLDEILSKFDISHIKESDLKKFKMSLATRRRQMRKKINYTGSTTIESIAMEKDHSEEVSRVH